MTPRTLVRTMRLAAILAVPACSSDDVDYSVATTKPVRSASRFEVGRSDYRIRQVLTLGTADGDSTEVFGFVTDAAFGPRGSIYVADVGQRRIVPFDSSGRFLRSIGRPGQEPGEFLDPSSLAWIADTLFIYDGGQGRIIVLDTTGLFQRSFPSPSAWVDRVFLSPHNGVDTAPDNSMYTLTPQLSAAQIWYADNVSIAQTFDACASSNVARIGLLQVTVVSTDGRVAKDYKLITTMVCA